MYSESIINEYANICLDLFEIYTAM
jgi:hypothetical protein